jgi:serine/threonine protein kinase
MLRKPVAVCVLKGPGEAIGEREADILSTIGRHPHIVQFLARSINTQGQPIVVLELATLRQNLHQVLTTLEDSNTVLSDEVLHMILYQIANGMSILHENGIVHKDLAARNILMFSFDPSNADHNLVKISDFGMSSLLDSSAASSYYYGGGKELPVRWMAPETLNRNKWSEKSDVYSFGVLIWEMLSMGMVPWGLGVSNQNIQEQVTRGDKLPCQSHWPSSLVELINKCCTFNPKDRPSFLELMAQLHQSQSCSKGSLPAGEAHVEDSLIGPGIIRCSDDGPSVKDDLGPNAALLGHSEEQVSVL